MNRLNILPFLSRIFRWELALYTIILAFGVSCELPPPREIYNPGFTLNKMEEFPLGWILERGLASSVRKVEGPNEKMYKLEITAEIENPVIFSQKVILKDSGSYFVIGKFKADIESGSFFVSAVGETFSKKSEFTKPVSTCKRPFFSFHIKTPEIVTLSIGFNKNSSGIAYPDTLSLFREDYFDPISIDARDMRAGLEKFSNINEMSGEKLDVNINKITNVLNVMFLSVDEDSTREMREFFSTDDFDTHQTSYLYSYVTDWIDDNAYDQKISLSVDELLKLYRIPVHQLYLKKECKAKHQFLEYYDAYDSKWKIIDPFYGVRYVDNSGEYLGIEDVEQLVMSGNFSSSNIKKLDIRYYKYDDMELLEKWRSLEPVVQIIKK